MKALTALLVGCALLFGVPITEASRATPTAEACEGLDAYGEAIIDVQTPVAVFMLEEGLGTMERDRLTISMPEWITVAETFEAAQAAMKGIEPPPGIAEWHEVQIEQLGYLSVWARTAARDGYPAAQRVSERGTGERLGEDSQRFRDQAVQTCPSFISILERQASLYRDPLAGTPTATPGG